MSPDIVILAGAVGDKALLSTGARMSCWIAAKATSPSTVTRANWQSIWPFRIADATMDLPAQALRPPKSFATHMTTQTFFEGDSQLVRLPAGFQFAAGEIEIRREGDAVILEPIRPSTWSAGFFESIRISDAEFRRPDQGVTPAAPRL